MVKAGEEVQAAPKLRDRLTSYTKVATDDKQLEKAPVVVPYGDEETPVYAPETQQETKYELPSHWPIFSPIF